MYRFIEQWGSSKVFYIDNYEDIVRYLYTSYLPYCLYLEIIVFEDKDIDTYQYYYDFIERIRESLLDELKWIEEHKEVFSCWDFFNNFYGEVLLSSRPITIEVA